MLSRVPVRQLSVVSSISQNSRLRRWLDVYEDFVGLKEVKQAQKTVNEAERSFIDSQVSRRTHAEDLSRVQNELTRVRNDMDRLSRRDQAYLELFQRQIDLENQEREAESQLREQDNIERNFFSALQIALRESQEKEKMRIERTKYWSITGSVIGALVGIIGARIADGRRKEQFRDIALELQQPYEETFAKQDHSFQEFRNELITTSSKEYEHLLLLTKQSEERLQTKIVFQTGVMLVSVSCLTLIISYFLNR